MSTTINLGKVVPQKGVDYFTAEEIAEFKSEISGDLQSQITQNANDINSLEGAQQNDEGVIGNYTDTFSTSSTYAVGDIVIKDKKIYRCITAITTAGAWDSSKWEELSVRAEQNEQNEYINELNKNVSDFESNMTSENKVIIGAEQIFHSLKYRNKIINSIGADDISQDTSEKTYTCIGTESGDYYFVYDNTNYQFTMPTVSQGSVLVFDTLTLKLYLGVTEITTTTASTGTLITLSDTPNPDYERPIKLFNDTMQINTSNKNMLDIFSEYLATDASKISASAFKNKITVINSATTTNNAIGWFIPVGKNREITISYSSLEKTAGTYNNSVRYGFSDTIITPIDSTMGTLLDTTNKFATITSTGTYMYVLVRCGNKSTVVIEDLMVSYSSDKVYVQHEGQSFPLAIPSSIYLGNLGDAENIIFKNTKDNPNYNINLIENAWYWKKHLHKVIFDGTETITKVVKASAPLGYYFTIDLDKTAYYIDGSASNISANMKCSNFQISGNAYSEIANGIISMSSSKNKISIGFDETVEGLDTYLSNHNTTIIYVLQTPEYIQITDNTLIEQLENLYKFMTYKNITSFTITGGNIDGKIDFDYYRDASLEDKARIEKLEEDNKLLKSNLSVENKTIVGSDLVANSLHYINKLLNSIGADTINQDTTTGIQLFNSKVMDNSYYQERGVIIEDDGTIKLTNVTDQSNGYYEPGFKLSQFCTSLAIGDTAYLYIESDWTARQRLYGNHIGNWENGSSIIVTQDMLDDKVVFYGGYETTSTIKVMITKDTYSSNYEKYTGVTASPNPDYPQPISIFNDNMQIDTSSKNILDARTDNWVRSSSVTLTIDNNKITVSNPSSTANRAIGWNVKIDQTRDVTISYSDLSVLVGNSGMVQYFFSDSPVTNFSTADGTTVSSTNKYVTVTPTGKYLFVYIRCGNGAKLQVTDLMVSYSSDLTYVSHEGQSFPLTIPSSIYLGKLDTFENIIFKNTKDNPNYNDTLTENAWYWKKAWNKLVLDGSESWSIENTETENYYYTLDTTNIVRNTAAHTILCNKYYYNTIGNSNTNQGIYLNNTSNTKMAIRIRYGVEKTLGAFKAELAEDNAIVCYQFKNAVYTQITDATLVEQLEALSQFMMYRGQTNIIITGGDIAGKIDFDYYKDDRVDADGVSLSSKLASLEARVTLLED